MKTIYFVRHAKSDWSVAARSDHDRPLNARGRRDALKMAQWMSEKKIEVDSLIVSSACRTTMTAQYFLENLKISEQKMVIEPKIYESSAETIIKIIYSLNNNLNTVMIFGHNPAFTELANRFSTAQIDNVPTCGIFQIAADVQDWHDFLPAQTKLVAFYYPKQFFLDALD